MGLLDAGKTGTGQAEPAVVNFRCPHCRHVGAFHRVANVLDAFWQEHEKQPNGNISPIDCGAGVRVCPNLKCRGLVFVVTRFGDLVESYPAVTIDFDSENLPPRLLSTLEEAIKCHGAGCYRAAALMIRRTLEELCEDKQAKGADLKARLRHLGANVTIPSELLDAADSLRLLGNDAAHIEAKTYGEVEEPASSAAIELAKELLKTVYQYGALVGKLNALRKTSTNP